MSFPVITCLVVMMWCACGADDCEAVATQGFNMADVLQKAQQCGASLNQEVRSTTAQMPRNLISRTVPLAQK